MARAYWLSFSLITLAVTPMLASFILAAIPSRVSFPVVIETELEVPFAVNEPLFHVPKEKLKVPVPMDVVGLENPRKLRFAFLQGM